MIPTYDSVPFETLVDIDVNSKYLCIDSRTFVVLKICWNSIQCGGIIQRQCVMVYCVVDATWW